MYSGNEGTSVPFNVVLLFVQQVPCSHKIENGEVCINFLFALRVSDSALYQWPCKLRHAQV